MNNKAFAKLLDAVNKAKTGTTNRSDDAFWKCEKDRANNGFAVIRFLPTVSDDDVPFIKIYNHGFKIGSKWFIENCPTTIGEDCPVCTSNNTYWDEGSQASKDIARGRKRRLGYISNILVVSDPKNPDNEGKVLLFKYGQKIFDKIVDAMQPEQEEGEEPIDPMNAFDLDLGADFKLKIREVEKFPNYDKSSFAKPSKVDNADAIMTELHDLNKFNNKSEFKPYAELETKLNQVLGNASATKVQESEEQDDAGFVEKVVKAAKSTPAEKKAAKTEEGEDSDLDYFRQLAAADD